MRALRGDLLAWAAAAVDAEARVVAVTPLREGGAPWLLHFEDESHNDVVLRTGDPTSAQSRTDFRTEAAALDVAANRGLPTPRVIDADLDGSAAGCLAILIDVLPGVTRIPREARPERLLALGTLVAQISEVARAATPDLPVRRRSLESEDFLQSADGDRSGSLFREAHDALGTLQDREGPTVLVHGDLWQGNTVWDGDRLTGLLDWDCAGVGAPGLDLGTLRCDTALMYGGRAPDIVLKGWLDAGPPRVDVARYDVIAALSTPPNLAQWVAPIGEQGRGDLDAATLNDRRDGFLAAALRQLHRYR